MGRNIREASEEKQEEMMSMTRGFPARMRPVVDAAPRIDVVQSDKEALTGSGFTALLERAAQQILAGTACVASPPHVEPSSLPVRVSGPRTLSKAPHSLGHRGVPT